ncbi:MAG: glutathione S-transferase family protein [Candidatus Pacebacteria bacterium]|nr:glutathione S-transferase family protein [Candidatus Paceibacterota bacterium]
MIDLYSYTTPNGYRVGIMLEECGLPYRTHIIDLRSGMQKTPEFLAINPNGKIPAIVDHDGAKPISVFESAAILFYLSEKTGRFMPKTAAARAEMWEWQMIQASGLSPMIGQLFYFMNYATEKPESVLKRYRDETMRLLALADQHLKGRSFFVGDEISLADIGWIPVVATVANSNLTIDGLDHLKAWCDRMTARPAVQKGMKLVASS